MSRFPFSPANGEMPASYVLLDVSNATGVRTAVVLSFHPVTPVFDSTAIDQDPATVFFHVKSNVALAPAAHEGVATVVGAPKVIAKTKLAHVSVVLVMSLLN
jgi:hypothetical protein